MADKAKLLKSWLPMTETAFYILLSFDEPRHGYSVTKFVSELTEERIKLGSGTLYTTLSKMLKDGLIAVYDNSDKKTVYERTETGTEILMTEIVRLRTVYNDIEKVYGREATA
ncbi:MAG: PadR family transcriptional regulator [Oribacterium sp.]|nr:PadR family transcriptional regulator [Oribacterium sp.]MBQ5330742.1 PadR family transcriptional regulator [Oscillospiraceae bacterium]